MTQLVFERSEIRFNILGWARWSWNTVPVSAAETAAAAAPHQQHVDHLCPLPLLFSLASFKLCQVF